ncbi:MAG: CAP domain-containing protein [Pseudonocardiaceae bacterium]
MTIGSTTMHRWKRRLGWGAAVVLAAGGMLLPASGSAVAQQSTCADLPRGGSPLSQVTLAERTTVLQLHNNARSEVGVPPLTWSDPLADAAQGWANVLVSQQGGPLFFCHEPFSRTGQGENIAYNSTVRGGVIAWYNEKSQYESDPNKVIILNPPQAQNFRLWGHYSQMVWSKTAQIGCGKASSTQYPIVLVCRYLPPGNVVGQVAY